MMSKSSEMSISTSSSWMRFSAASARAHVCGSDHSTAIQRNHFHPCPRIGWLTKNLAIRDSQITDRSLEAFTASSAPVPCAPLSPLLPQLKFGAIAMDCFLKNEISSFKPASSRDTMEYSSSSCGASSLANWRIQPASAIARPVSEKKPSLVSLTLRNRRAMIQDSR